MIRDWHGRQRRDRLLRLLVGKHFRPCAGWPEDAMSVVDVQRLDHPDDQAGHAGQGEFAGESEQRGVGVRQREIGQPYVAVW